MAIPKYITENFETLKRAFHDNRVAVMECTEVATGNPAYAICAVADDADDPTKLNFVPFGTMFAVNPFDALLPPEGATVERNDETTETSQAPE